MAEGASQHVTVEHRHLCMYSNAARQWLLIAERQVV